MEENLIWSVFSDTIFKIEQTWQCNSCCADTLFEPKTAGNYLRLFRAVFFILYPILIHGRKIKNCCCSKAKASDLLIA